MREGRRLRRLGVDLGVELVGDLGRELRQEARYLRDAEARGLLGGAQLLRREARQIVAGARIAGREEQSALVGGGQGLGGEFAGGGPQLLEIDMAAHVAALAALVEQLAEHALALGAVGPGADGLGAQAPRQALDVLGGVALEHLRDALGLVTIDLLGAPDDLHGVRPGQEPALLGREEAQQVRGVGRDRGRHAGSLRNDRRYARRALGVVVQDLIDVPCGLHVAA